MLTKLLYIIPFIAFFYYKRKYVKEAISKIDVYFKKKSKEKSFDEIYNALGYFEYFVNGFKYKNETIVKWEDINQINAYKKDILTYDLIILEVHFSDKILTLNEETPGWFQLVLKLKEVFSTIPKDWDIVIMQPAFERNFTIIYQKK